MSAQLPQTMRAAQWTSSAGGLDKNLKLNTQVPLPKNAKSLSAGQTLVKVAYSAINPIDYKLAENPVAGYALPKPATPGLDFSGSVVSTKNAHLKEGDRVFGRTELPTFGCLAEYIVVGEAYVSPIPEGVSFQDAAATGVAALAAYQSLVPYVHPGHDVFINGGSGGTGTFGIQFAKALGARVTTTCSAANVELVKSLGADVVIDYTKEELLQHLKDRGKYYDLFVDNVFADRRLYWQSHFFTEPAAHYVTPGDTNMGAIRDLGLAHVWPGMLGGGQRPFVFVRAEPGGEARAQIGEWIKEGKVKPVIEQEYALEDAGKAFTRLKTGRTKGKILIKVS